MDKSGITLVELLIVISIIAIVALWGYPEYERFVRDSRVRSGATDLLQNMKLAKALAMKENRTYLIVFDVNNNRYTIGFDGDSDEALTSATDGYGGQTGLGYLRVKNLSDYGTSGVANLITYGSGTCTADGAGGDPVKFTGDKIKFGLDGSVKPLGSVYFQHSRGDCYRMRVSTFTGQSSVHKCDGAEWVELR